MDKVIKRGKDVLTTENKMNVVYKINCADCKACYVGQTKRHVLTRVNEHRSDIRRNLDDLSVVSRYRVEKGHDFDWSKINILHQEKHLRKREIVKMIYIKKNSDSINVQKDTDRLPVIYDHVLTNIGPSPSLAC
ncbi:hypothetical protein X777_16386 [Ooceraea biroi]|uniref:GIY-YIG domain-containing protein n=1 Tax=Ooceraea biroi TaxID=2015173 RepID=A0A026VUI8_OOCBI|nr:hypothetical protein X777_16386 [Ooceraea biroi]